MNDLRLGSLCSGYGGVELGLQLAGVAHELVFVADPDKAASTVLATHHPGVPNLGDITVADWSAVPAVDVLTAGFPCQDVSLAGRRAGLAPGTRTGIWLHVAQAIGQLRPSLVILENVRGLLSAPAHSDVEPCPWCMGSEHGQPVLRALGAVLGDLAELGYDACWTSVPASAVGAPHQRMRVFIAAWPADTACPRLETGRAQRHRASALADAARFGHRDTGTPGRQGLRPATVSGDPDSAGLTLFRTPTAQLAVNGGSQPPDKRRAGGHGPTLADEVEHLLPTPAAVRSGRQQSPSDGAAVRPSLDMITALLPTPLASDAAKGGPNSYFGNGDPKLAAAVQPDRWGDYALAIRRWEGVLGRPAPEPTETSSRGGQRLSPRFVEWMLGLAPGYVTDHVPRNDALRLCGNGVVPLQLAAAVHDLSAFAALTAPEPLST